MKIKEKNGQLEITITAYQAKSGAIYLNWGDSLLLLLKEHAEKIARDIPGFDNEQFNNFYNN